MLETLVMHVIYSGTFHCDLCSNEVTFNVLGTEEIDDRTFEQDAADYARHDHWSKYHRVCAICGDLIGDEDLDLAVNDGRLPIHDRYTHDYGTKVQRGDLSHCLLVHKRCVT